MLTFLENAKLLTFLENALLYRNRFCTNIICDSQMNVLSNYLLSQHFNFIVIFLLLLYLVCCIVCLVLPY